MQIDGHHAATYVAARLAGFPFEEAEKIAYAAQYVDDATNAGVIRFNNSDYLYARIASAHCMVDYDNFVDVENHLAWIPFHFLPGNAGLAAGQSPPGEAFQKLICLPDTPIARDMLRQAMLDRDKPRGLHRLGIAMHVYADTFAHQGFVGSRNPANRATSVTSGKADLDELIKSSTKKELLQAILCNLKRVFQIAAKTMRLLWHEHKSIKDFFNSFMRDAPVGHAGVDVYPDLPYLNWQYINYHGETVQRDNTEIFVTAVDMMVRAMQAWRQGDQSIRLQTKSGMLESDRLVVSRLFRLNADVSGEVRHAEWLKVIQEGKFSFGSEVPHYVAKGPGSWKEIALGTEKSRDSGYERFDYTPDFLQSDWKLFHDALQVHRSDVVHEILPHYGICAA